MWTNQEAVAAYAYIIAISFVWLIFKVTDAVRKK
jgi:hypothetical protein